MRDVRSVSELTATSPDVDLNHTELHFWKHRASSKENGAVLICLSDWTTRKQHQTNFNLLTNQSRGQQFRGLNAVKPENHILALAF